MGETAIDRGGPTGHTDPTRLGRRLRALLGDIVGPERAAGIDDDTDLVDDVLLDSIQMIAFLLRVEDELDVEVDFDSLGLDHVRTLRSFTAFLAEGTGAGPAARAGAGAGAGADDREPGRW